MLTKIIAASLGMATTVSALENAPKSAIEEKIMQDLTQIINNYDFSNVISTAMTEE